MFFFDYKVLIKKFKKSSFNNKILFTNLNKRNKMTSQIKLIYENLHYMVLLCSMDILVCKLSVFLSIPSDLVPWTHTTWCEAGTGSID